MLERNRQVEEKRDELYKLKWNDFIDRVLAYEGHDSLRSLSGLDILMMIL